MKINLDKSGRIELGAGDGDRTRDILLGKQHPVRVKQVDPMGRMSLNNQGYATN